MGSPLNLFELHHPHKYLVTNDVLRPCKIYHIRTRPRPFIQLSTRNHADGNIEDVHSNWFNYYTCVNTDIVKNNKKKEKIKMKK